MIDRYRREIEEMHAFISAWFRGSVANDAVLYEAEFARRLDPALVNIQPSGQYTATLTFLGAPSTEIGRLSVTSEQLTLYREFPSADTATGTLRQLSQSRVLLTSSTRFDFPPLDEPEDAELRTELLRQ